MPPPPPMINNTYKAPCKMVRVQDNILFHLLYKSVPIYKTNSDKHQNSPAQEVLQEIYHDSLNYFYKVQQKETKFKVGQDEILQSVNYKAVKKRESCQ